MNTRICPYPTVEIATETGIFTAIDLPAVAARSGADLIAMPFVIRVLLENLCRHHIWSAGRTVKADEVEAVMHWQTRIGSELPLHVARVILPDSSGIPVLQDLAALRDAVARAGKDPSSIDVRLPLHLVVDHSLQVDEWGTTGAMANNLRREYARNDERYAFIKWAQQAFKGLQVFPPGTGIIHQINLEIITQVVMTAMHDARTWAFPDFVIGGDSHTPMINALGVLGWGVGGIDAEAALLGRAYTFPVPEVVGVRLHGSMHPAAFTTDLVLRVTEVLRREDVVNCAVEFFGPAVAGLTVPQRATLSNMAPEYGATCGFFPVDRQTLDYLRMTGRSEHQIALIDAYCRRNALLRDAGTAIPAYARIVDVDLSQAVPSLAGPRRPQDRMNLEQVAGDFRRRLAESPKEGGFGAPGDVGPDAHSLMPQHGAVVIAAITSCTNTSNPEVMLAAGIVAKKAAQRGLKPPAWVKTSLAPGSRAVTRYLDAAGLLQPLAQLGFQLVGYGCTTCGGKSGPLDDDVATAIQSSGGVAVAVLSGNRNFEGRIHKLVRANYIGAPPLVVIYALAGRIDIDLERDPVGIDYNGVPVYMRDLLPEPDELAEAMRFASDPQIFRPREDSFDPAVESWRSVAESTGACFAWDSESRYLVEPPFFAVVADGDRNPLVRSRFQGARVLAAFGDSLTTDHVSPGGEIPADTPAGRYLLDQGIKPRDFNTYVARRGNHHVMARATFANIRIRNALVDGTEGGFTQHFPDRRVMTIFDAAEQYRNERIPTIVLAGRDYGSGSSRDWAAKGTALLGVVAVIAESFERIHRANLVGMGVVPLTFRDGEGWRRLGLAGDESFDFEGIEAGVRGGSAIRVVATRPSGEAISFEVIAAVLTASERQLMADGGIPRSVLTEFTGASPATSI